MNFQKSIIAQPEIIRRQKRTKPAFINPGVWVILLETGFREDSNIFPRFLERIHHLNEDDIHLFHSFCNKFLDKEK